MLHDAAIRLTAQVYGIDISKADVQFDPTLPKKYYGVTDLPPSQDDPSPVRLGKKAFQSPQILALTLGHECEVHVNRQIEKGNWSWKDVGSAVLEIEAYDYEIANAKRFGLDEAMLRETVANRNDYYKQLPKKYRDRVDVANYRLDQADM